MTNEALREHVTSIGFSLTLSKNMIETVVLMDYFGGFNRFHRAVRNLPPGRSYVSSAHALTRRGLFRLEGYEGGRECEHCARDFCDHKLTTAGALSAALLQECGIYQDVLAKYGFDQKSDAA
ncbi:hypothetical protein ONA92_02270 [Mycobacteroides salmoniphilum]|uniref:hypothetical protein n=1 Tax=Mycobacteroides salmoniphilum TaxID=404941 RepID=UPI003569CBA8